MKRRRKHPNNPICTNCQFVQNVGVGHYRKEEEDEEEEEEEENDCTLGSELLRMICVSGEETNTGTGRGPAQHRLEQHDINNITQVPAVLLLVTTHQIR